MKRLKKNIFLPNKELQDMLNDHTQINNAFDSIIEILSEPGIKKDFILNLRMHFFTITRMEYSIN